MNIPSTMTTTDHINAVMDRFDFKRVHVAMKALDWKWHETEAGPDRVPEKVDLRRAARDFLEYAAGDGGKGERYISSGGFVARRDRDGDLSLEFVVEGVAVGKSGYPVA